MFKLRVGTAFDVDAMTALDELCFSEVFRFSRAAMRRFSQGPNRHTLIAETSTGEMAGFAVVSFHFKHEVAYLVTLDVAPAFQRQGLARMLILATEALVANHQLAIVEVDVHTGNGPALALYKSCGYSGNTLKPDFYAPGFVALSLHKNLGNR